MSKLGVAGRKKEAATYEWRKGVRKNHEAGKSIAVQNACGFCLNMGFNALSSGEIQQFFAWFGPPPHVTPSPFHCPL
jgi:hypothetical protein